MKVTLIAAGSRGDVQPYLALAQGLNASGHAVTLASAPTWRRLSERCGVAFTSFRDDPGDALDVEEAAPITTPGTLLSKRLLALPKLVDRSRGFIRRLLEDTHDACAGADLIIAGLYGFGAPHVAERYGARMAWGLLQPMTPTRRFPLFLVPQRYGHSGTLNLATYAVAHELYRRLLAGEINDFRERVLKLPALAPRLSVHGARAPHAVLYGHSRYLVDRPNDWPREHQVTGPWRLSRSISTLQPSVDEFLRSGPPPIFVGLSSVAGASQSDLAARLSSALARRGQRALVQCDRELPERLRSDQVCVVRDELDYASVFSRCRAVVCHGGLGTLTASLTSGCPVLSVYGVFDQAFWAYRAHAVGAGARPCSVRRTTEERLGQALDELLSARLQHGARKLAALMQNEDGVPLAVKLLQRGWVADRSPRGGGHPPPAGASPDASSPEGRPAGRAPRALIITYTMLNPKVGGAFFRAIRLGLELQRRGWSVTIANDGPWLDDPKSDAAREKLEFMELRRDVPGFGVELLRRQWAALSPDLAIMGEGPFDAMEVYYDASRALPCPFAVLDQFYNHWLMPRSAGVDLVLQYGLLSFWKQDTPLKAPYVMVPPFIEAVAPRSRLPLPPEFGETRPLISFIAYDDRVLAEGGKLLSALNRQDIDVACVCHDPARATAILAEAGVSEARRQVLPLQLDDIVFGLALASRVLLVSNGFLQIMEGLALECPVIALERGSGVGMGELNIDSRFDPYVSYRQSTEQQCRRVHEWLRGPVFSDELRRSLRTERHGTQICADHLERLVGRTPPAL